MYYKNISGSLRRSTAGRGSKVNKDMEPFMPKLTNDTLGMCKICGRVIKMDSTLPAEIFEGELKTNVHFKCWKAYKNKTAN